MRRREFIAGIGSVAAWRVVARAQQTDLPVFDPQPQNGEGAWDRISDRAAGTRRRGDRMTADRSFHFQEEPLPETD